jgi:hypothetical protein
MSHVAIAVICGILYVALFMLKTWLSIVVVDDGTRTRMSLIIFKNFFLGANIIMFLLAVIVVHQVYKSLQ